MIGHMAAAAMGGGRSSGSRGELTPNSSYNAHYLIMLTEKAIQGHKDTRQTAAQCWSD